MIPLINPEYHSSLVSALAMGNGLLKSLKIRGRKYTLMNLTIGIRHIIINDAPRAFHLFWVVKREAPKYAKINAWKMYLID
jgi:uncharacterized membrane protein